MQILTEISFHGIDHSDSAEAAIQRWVARLEHVYDRITSCNVVVSQPHKRQRHGRDFQVSVVIEVPGGDISVTHVTHEDIYVAIADAFRAARRQVQHHVELRRGFVKTHIVERTGNIGMNVAKHRADAG